MSGARTDFIYRFDPDEMITSSQKSSGPVPLEETVTEYGVKLTVKRISFTTMLVLETQERFEVEEGIAPSHAYWIWRNLQIGRLPLTRECLQKRLVEGELKLFRKSFCAAHQQDLSLNFVEMDRKDKLQPTCKKCYHDLFKSGSYFYQDF